MYTLFFCILELLSLRFQVYLEATSIPCYGFFGRLQLVVLNEEEQGQYENEELDF